MASNGFSIFSLIPLGGRKGGSPSSKGIYVGMVTKGSSFPTRRLDGSSLQTEDYVKVDPETPLSDFPFTISGVTFSTKKDQAFYLGSNRWQIDPGAIQTTSETPTTNRDAESLNGNGTTQAQVNLQVANMIGRKKSVEVADKTNILDALNFAWEELQKAGYTFTLENTDADSIRSFVLTIKDYNNEILLTKTLNDFVLKGRKVAGYDLADDITPQEIQDAIKELTATLKNKSMSADDNTFTDFETDNFKNSALAKSTDGVRDYNNSEDTKLTTEKFIQKVLQNIFTPQNESDAVNKKYVDDVIEELSGKVMQFKGFVSSTAPTGTIKNGSFWYQGSTMPTTFPINVKIYDADTQQWSSATVEYTPNTMDLWSNLNDNKGYYWFGNQWNLIDENVLVDDVMIEKNQNGELTFKTKTSADEGKAWVVKADGTFELKYVLTEVDSVTIELNNSNQVSVKDAGITKEKLNSNVADGSTIEKDTTNGLQVKDGGITDDKLNSDIKIGSLADLLTSVKTSVVNAINELFNNKVDKTNGVNKIYGTDENGKQKLWDTSAFGGFTDDTDYGSSPNDNNKLSNVDLSTGKVKHITFGNLWTWITSKITGAISTVLTDNLTGGRAVITNTSGKLTVAAAITAQTTQAIYPVKLSATGLVSEVGTGQAITDQYKTSANNQLLNRAGANTMWKQTTKMVGIFKRTSSINVTTDTMNNVTLQSVNDNDTTYCQLASNGCKILKAGIYRIDITMRLQDSVGNANLKHWNISVTNSNDGNEGGGWESTFYRHKQTESFFVYYPANTIVYPMVYPIKTGAITGNTDLLNYVTMTVSCVKES